MLSVWAVVTFFMLRFLIKVIKTPQEKKDTEGTENEESLHPQDTKTNHEN